MKKFVWVVFALVLYASVVSAALASQDLARCREWFKKDFPATAEKSEVVSSPVPGVCEVHSGLNVLYYVPPKKGQGHGFLFVGGVFTPTGENLTKVSRDKLVEKAVLKLDFSKAIKIGEGPVKVIEFSDPSCPFCKRLEQFFNSYPEISSKVTRYVFLFPLKEIHPDAEKKSEWILCQKDPGKAFEEVMAENSTVSDFSLPEGCDLKEVKDRMAYFRKAAEVFGVQGTPFVIVGNTIVPGFDPGFIAAEVSQKSVQNQKAKNPNK